MDVIEKRVSGNERVHNCWAAGQARSDPVAVAWRPGAGPPPSRPTYRAPHATPALNNLPETDTLAKVVQPSQRQLLSRFLTSTCMHFGHLHSPKQFRKQSDIRKVIDNSLSDHYTENFYWHFNRIKCFLEQIE